MLQIKNKKNIISFFLFFIENIFNFLVLKCFDFNFISILKIMMIQNLVLYFANHYSLKNLLIWDEINALIKSFIIILLILMVWMPKKLIYFIIYCAIQFVFSVTVSRSLRIIFRSKCVDNVLIIGTNKEALTLKKVSLENRFSLINVVGFVKINEHLENEFENENIYNFNDVDEVIKRENINFVIISEPGLDNKLLDEIVKKVRSKVSKISFMPDIKGLINFDSDIEDYDGLLLISSIKGKPSLYQRFLKRLIDIVGAIVGIILLAPIYLYVKYKSIKSNDDGPIIFSQQRIGKNGKPFKIYKFRTMIVGAEEKLKEMMENDPKIREEYIKNKKLENDPRITQIGKKLRETSLDEFPQFINVLKGDMSLVGPRPYLLMEKEEMGDYYNSVIKCKPGVTGMWQSHGRSDVGFTERLELDDYYYNNWTIWLDIVILIKTIKNVIHGDSAI